MAESAAVPLKPCPFCGGDAWVSLRHGNKMLAVTRCMKCKARGPGDDRQDATEAARAWNTRVEPPPPTEEQIEAIREVIPLVEKRIDKAGAQARQVLTQLLSSWTRKEPK